MILAAHQAHYLPYPGLLAKIAAADVFVLQNDLQYVKQEWQNRNRIRTSDGWRWLTIPVHASSVCRICDVVPASAQWVARHRRLVQLDYRAVGTRLGDVEQLWEEMQQLRAGSLAEIGRIALLRLCRWFGISTPIVLQSELRLTPAECRTRGSRLVALCRRFGCDTYLSGTGATAYLQPAEWDQAQIALLLLQWQPVPYPQCHPGWIPNLSSLDMYLCAPDAAGMLAAGTRISPGRAVLPPYSSATSGTVCHESAWPCGAEP